MTDVIGEGSLKLVTGCSPHRSLSKAIGDVLRGRTGATDVRDFGGDTFAVFTSAEPDAIRDWLTPVLADDESVIIVEFERWSSHGGAVDTRWLLRRGH